MVAKFCGYLGAAVMVAAPFIIDTPTGKGMAILGLTLLTVEAYSNRGWNLVALNIVSIGGFGYSLIGG